MNTPTITFIGAGNMASSLLGGLVANGYDPQRLWATNPEAEKLEQLETRLGICTTTDNKLGADQADVVVLTVKPQVLKTVVHELAEIIAHRRPLIISVAAGIRATQIRQWLGGEPAIVRCMPNTPALVGSGATALYANPAVDEAQRDLAETILRAVGITVWLQEESQLDIATALSGCGPAYFFLVMEALQEGAKALGLDAEAARLLTLQTALGAAKMALESEKNVLGLRQQVTSPGGTTEQALKVLEQGGLRELFQRALQAAQQRADELANLFA